MRTELPVLEDLRMDLPAPDVTGASAAAGLLADPIRASIIRLLRDGPVCVCEMAAALGSRENNVSNHLARLREAGLVRPGPRRHGHPARVLRARRRGDRGRAGGPRRGPAVTTLAARAAHGPALADGPRRRGALARRLVPRAAALDLGRLRRPAASTRRPSSARPSPSSSTTCPRSCCCSPGS